MGYVNSIGIGVSLVVTSIGMFYAYKCWRLWRHTKINGIGVEVTKSRTFLSTNFKLVLVIGAFNGLHVVFEALENLELLSPSWLKSIFELLYHLNIIVIMSAILVLAVSWYKLLSKVNQWDKRWIR